MSSLKLLNSVNWKVWLCNEAQLEDYIEGRDWLKLKLLALKDTHRLRFKCFAEEDPKQKNLSNLSLLEEDESGNRCSLFEDVTLAFLYATIEFSIVDYHFFTAEY